jgi:hypothetical protein
MTSALKIWDKEMIAALRRTYRENWMGEGRDDRKTNIKYENRGKSWVWFCAGG